MKKYTVTVSRCRFFYKRMASVRRDIPCNVALAKIQTLAAGANLVRKTL